MAKAVKSKQVRIKYVIPDDLKDLYVNGVYGGVIPPDSIKMHFFSERLPIPDEEHYEVEKDGSLGKRVKSVAGGQVVRLIQASIAFDLATAKVLHKWLAEKIEFIEQRQVPERKTKEGKQE